MLKNSKSIICAWILYCIFLIGIHIIIKINFGDDVGFYATSWISFTKLDYLKYVYFSMSSRVIIWFVNSFLSGHSYWIWKILNILAMLLMTYSICSLFRIEKDVKKTLLVMGAIMFCPITLWNSAGWIATTTDYLWPASAMLFWIQGIIKEFRGKKPKVIEYIVMIFALIYAADMEQTCALAVCCCILFLFFMLKKKKTYWIVIVSSFISLAMLVFILTCPGNASRNWMAEITLYTGYEQYGLFTKIYMGFTNTWDGIIHRSHILIPIVFSLICAIAVWLKNKNIIARVISVVPVVFFGIIAINNFSVEVFSVGKSIQSQTAVINLFNFNQARAYVRCSVYFVMTGFLFATIFLTIDKNFEKIILMIMMFLGFSVSIASGLSSSVYVSFYRTDVYLLIIMVLSTVYYVIDTLKSIKKKKVYISLITVFFVIGIANNIRLFRNL